MHARRVLFAALASLTMVIVLLGVTAHVASAKPTAAVKYANTAHTATNTKRAKHGLVKLKKNACLQKLALAQAKKMAKARKLSHQDLGRVQRRCAMGWVGENVAYGYPTGKAVVRGWMNSPGHRANILRKQFRLMGIAAVKRGGIWYVAQVFGRRA